MGESYKNCLLVITLYMILFPPAKINLGLNVLKKRVDGFHDLDTCMIPIPLCDVLEILPAKEFSFQQTGLVIEGESTNNIVIKAFKLVQQYYNIGNVYIHLRKNIPMGAGLGGGSADGTYTILALNEIFNLQLSNERMRELSGELGSDCPFFVENKAQIAKGRGELLSPVNLDLSGYYLKLINPNVHISTAEAYAGVGFYDGARSVEQIIKQPISTWKGQLQNSFEESAFNNHSVLERIKNELYSEGAIYAAMSGSGSTMFGVFKEEPTLTTKFSIEFIYEM